MVFLVNVIFRHDTWHNDILRKNTKHNDTQWLCRVLFKLIVAMKSIMLIVFMLNVVAPCNKLLPFLLVT